MARGTSTTPAKKKRAARPASERAQEEFDTANRVVAAAEDRLAKAQAVVVEREAEVAAATRRRDYAALHPDLPAQTDGAPVETVDGGTA